jgi:phosphoglycerate kinase
MEVDMNRKRSVRDADVQGKRVFVRVDFNVPLDAAGAITDDTRIRASLPTITYLLERGAAVILASHLGRPKGKVVDAMSLKPAAVRLSEFLARPVTMAPDAVGPAVEQLAAGLEPGDVLLLENLRFHPEEEANDEGFARQLAALADLYVNDAFGSAHRAHASTEAIARLLPAYAGLLMQKELDALGSALTNPEHPFLVIIGGAKISSKVGVLRHLLSVADGFLIGGGMANTLLRARGYEVGASLVEEDKIDVAREFLQAADRAGKAVHLPVDAVIAREVTGDAPRQTVAIDQVEDGWRIVDIGPETVKAFGDVIAGANTILWNGPMGVFEVPAFAEGTRAIACLLAGSTATTIVGGGDSVAAVEQSGLAARMSHISTGGGASLEFLEGRVLPGVAVLQDAPAPISV